jgi:hypothetical protein
MPIALSHWNTTRFVLKHLAASSAIVAGSGVLAAASWMATYLWAAMTSNGSEPAVTFVSAVIGAWSSAIVRAVLVLLPATAIAEWIAIRARLRVWWQLPLAAFTVVAIGISFGVITAVTNESSIVLALRRAMTAAAPQLAALVVYWWALQSTDWLLRTAVRAAGWLLPARFGALARAQESATLLVSRTRARFRVREHFTFEDGATSVLVLSGSVIEGDVRSGMRACTTVNARELSARIQSVESSGLIGDQPSQLGLLLPLNDADMRIWQAAAREGSVVRIE